MIVKNKHQNIALAVGLHSDEFKCKCIGVHCNNVTIHPLFLKAWNQLRRRADMPIRFRSGYRCSLHNYDVGGVPLSRHLTGEAADFDLHDLLRAFENVTIIEKVLYQCGFTFIIINKEKGYVHADVRGKL